MRPELVTILVDAFRDAFKDGPIRSFYSGDPDVIPDFNLPALVVQKLSDETTVATVAEDDVEETILVKVILNKKDDWTVTSDETALTEQRIRRLVEARDAITNHFLPMTVKYVFREALEAQNFLLVGPLRFELGVLPRGQELVTAEGHLTGTIRYSVPTK